VATSYYARWPFLLVLRLTSNSRLPHCPAYPVGRLVAIECEGSVTQTHQQSRCGRRYHRLSAVLSLSLRSDLVDATVAEEWNLRCLSPLRIGSAAFARVLKELVGQFQVEEICVGTQFEWVVPHVYRKTVATLLHQGGLSARMIADQLGHPRISMMQDVYMGRRVVDGSVGSAVNLLFDSPETVDEGSGTTNLGNA
jgi:hypothetical protein